VLHNASIFQAERKRPTLLSGSFIRLVHEGRTRINRGFDLMCDLFEDEWMKNNARLKIVGNIINKELEYFQQRCRRSPHLSDCIAETGWLDYQDVPQAMADQHIGLILMDRTHYNVLLATPNKFFNYLAMGLPIVSLDLPILSDLISQYGFGVIVEQNISSLKAGILKVIQDYKFYSDNVARHRRKFSWPHEEKTLIALYESLLRDREAHRRIQSY
jgi:glycosyltransferase involved in cell wall biosynthesis